MSSLNTPSTNLSAGSRLARRLMTVLALITIGLGTFAVAPASAATSTSTSCKTAWGSTARTAAGSSNGDVVGVRTGRHTCFDRMVIDLDGSATGYRVEYVKTLTSDGSGAVIPVKGGAIIKVTALAPAYNDKGNATVDPAKVSALPVSRYRTFRDVEWAGSFEGQTTIGLGVRARLPFRVMVLNGPGNGSRLVIDVAHKW